MSIRIGTVVLIASLLAACGDSTPPEPIAPEGETSSAQASAEPETESEQAPAPGSSGKASETGDDEQGSDTSNVELLVALGLVRGHLHAANALYDAGETALAARQLEQPRKALDGELAQALSARDMMTFEDEVTSFLEAVDDRADADQVTETWRTADEAVESVGRDIDSTPKQELMSVAGLLDHVADRYRSGVVDNFVDNEHDYQASWGFHQIALQRVGQLNTTTDVPREPISEAAIVLANLEDLWPALNPVEKVYGKVERIELAADRIRGMADQLD